jgi:uncharacterized protein
LTNEKSNHRYSHSNQISEDSLPDRTGFVNDFEGLFSNLQKYALDSFINRTFISDSIELCIITIDSTMVTDEYFNDFILKIHNAWGIGKEVNKKGILIGISAGYKRIRISNGYGIENILSDEQTSQILKDYFFPYYKKGDYFEGTLNGLKAITTKLKTII